MRKLADALQQDTNAELIFDQYDLHPGKDLLAFMHRGVRADRIVVVVTPAYTEKARTQHGGAGYESMILSADMLADQLSDRVIPVLVAGEELPEFLRSKVYVDFRHRSFDDAFTELHAAINRQPIADRPPKRTRDMQTLAGPSGLTEIHRDAVDDGTSGRLNLAVASDVETLLPMDEAALPAALKQPLRLLRQVGKAESDRDDRVAWVRTALTLLREAATNAAASEWRHWINYLEGVCDLLLARFDSSASSFRRAYTGAVAYLAQLR